ncbi:helix-turn-helix domain-containing protein [[Mycoplasma] collis]|uniref:helix-turn-helix domain-containing protein n=1 Tax=[Mycoplasma] collis TaxID=2127 RepID=UPI00051C26DF|nr:helix-turn-helix domain-containing protein [[Mycoplasma] collis]
MEKNINNFFHLNQQNRLIIEKLLLNKWSHRRITKKLGVSNSIISREIKRNSDSNFKYSAKFAI